MTNLAESFIERFVGLVGDSFKQPHIVPVDDGVTLEWWGKNGARVLGIDIAPDGAINSLFMWKPNIWDGCEERSNPDDEYLVEVWKRLHD